MKIKNNIGIPFPARTLVIPIFPPFEPHIRNTFCVLRESGISTSAHADDIIYSQTENCAVIRGFRTDKRNDAMEWFARQYIGTRGSQQDRIRVSRTENGLLAAVCDGMGSKPDSAEAAQLAANTVINAYEQLDGCADIAGFLKSAVTEADEQVADSFDGSGGTTGVFAHIGSGGLSWFSVGDSRLYIYRGGSLIRLTRDHNYRYLLEKRLAEDIITREQYAAGLAKGNMLVSFIGMDGLFLADMSSRPLPLAQGDRILLTTDGLYRAIGEKTVANMLKAIQNAEAAADVLKESVSSLAGTVKSLDNTSFVIIDI